MDSHVIGDLSIFAVCTKVSCPLVFDTQWNNLSALLKGTIVMHAGASVCSTVGASMRQHSETSKIAIEMTAVGPRVNC